MDAWSITLAVVAAIALVAGMAAVALTIYLYVHPQHRRALLRFWIGR